MGKWRKKPVMVKAEVYKPGMEDGWGVLFSGEYMDYEKLLKTKNECEQFIKENGGLPMVSDEEINHEIIYEKPAPYIRALEGRHYFSPCDYIITGVKGERYSCKPDIFHATYEEVGEA